MLTSTFFYTKKLVPFYVDMSSKKHNCIFELEGVYRVEVC